MRMSMKKDSHELLRDCLGLIYDLDSMVFDLLFVGLCGEVPGDFFDEFVGLL